MVVSFLHRWLFEDFWVPVWPNLAAAAICAFHITRSNRKHLKLYIGSKEGCDHEETE